MVLNKNKKGMFFTLIAIALLSLFVASFALNNVGNDREEISSRIKSLNNFVFSLEEDLPRKLFISGFRIVFIYEKRILESGSYIGDVNSSFNEAFFDGTIEGSISTDEESLLSGVKFSDIQRDLSDTAAKINLDLQLSNPKISIYQVDPWNIKIEFNSDLSVIDMAGLATWNKTTTVEAFVPIKYFEDPIYLINLNGKVAHKINQTPFDTFISGSNTTNLSLHVQNFYYKESNEAPNFLMRLEGNLSGDINGIESLVYLPELSAQGFSIKDKSVVDHIYFSSEDPAKSSVSGMPSWFKLDNSHLSDYDIGGS